MKTDIRSAVDIEIMVKGFYRKILKDEVLAPIFLEVAGVNLSHHLPRICSYWEKLLLGTQGYRRHTINIHRRLHQKQPLSPADFERWLGLFRANVDELFSGENSERAKTIASCIAGNMQTRFEIKPLSC